MFVAGGVLARWQGFHQIVFSRRPSQPCPTGRPFESGQFQSERQPIPTLQRKPVQAPVQQEAQRQKSSGVSKVSNPPLPLPLKEIKSFQNYSMSSVVSALQQMGVKDMTESVVFHQFPIAGRVAMFAQNWNAISSDQWVLKCIQGYEIQWLQKPFQSHSPREIVSQEEEKTKISLEVTSMANKQAISEDSDPFSSYISAIVNFLASLFEDGYQYRSINNYRSAISSAHEKIDGYDVGQHTLVIRLLKGVFHQRPPQPRYSTTWDVSKVLSFIVTLGDNSTLTLIDLTHKTVMLLALTRPSRSVDLANLDTRFQQFSLEGVTFQSRVPAKQSRQSKPLLNFSLPLSLMMSNSAQSKP
eukprot:scpid47733/ scgid6802/ 